MPPHVAFFLQEDPTASLDHTEEAAAGTAGQTSPSMERPKKAHNGVKAATVVAASPVRKKPRVIQLIQASMWR